MKIVKFPEQRNHFIFDLKDGRRDVTNKPANKYKI